MTHEWSAKTDLSVALIGVGDPPSIWENRTSVEPTGTPPNPWGVRISFCADGRGTPVERGGAPRVGVGVCVGVGVPVAVDPVADAAPPAEGSSPDVEVQAARTTPATAIATNLIMLFMTDPCSGAAERPGDTRVSVMTRGCARRLSNQHCH